MSEIFAGAVLIGIGGLLGLATKPKEKRTWPVGQDSCQNVATGKKCRGKKHSHADPECQRCMKGERV